jgi:ABC-2 type transport system ATP-binding protein
VEVITADPLPQQPAVACERIALSEDRRSIVAISDRPARTLADLVKWIDQAGIEIEDIHLKRPTLEDVFIELTGRRLRE